MNISECWVDQRPTSAVEALWRTERASSNGSTILGSYSHYLFPTGGRHDIRVRSPAVCAAALGRSAQSASPRPTAYRSNSMGRRLELACVAHSWQELYVTTKLWLYAICGVAAAPSADDKRPTTLARDLYMKHCAPRRGAAGRRRARGSDDVRRDTESARPSERNGGVFPADSDALLAAASSRQLTAIGRCRCGRRVSRARARHRGAHGAPPRRRTRGVSRDATVSLAGAGKPAVTHREPSDRSHRPADKTPRAAPLSRSADPGEPL